jgi:hypothetical protein
MNVRTIPRVAVDRWLRVLRVPVDTTVGVLNRSGNAETATLVVDQADAAVRRFAGRVLRDEELQQDAHRRELAVDERRRALELRTEAELKRSRADEEYRSGLEVANEQRAVAEARAEQEQARVHRERDEAVARQAKETQQRKRQVRAAEARAEHQIDEAEQHARLEELEARAEVLEEKEDALVAASEAQRLQDAASGVKAKRKNGKRED